MNSIQATFTKYIFLGVYSKNNLIHIWNGLLINYMYNISSLYPNFIELALGVLKFTIWEDFSSNYIVAQKL